MDRGQAANVSPSLPAFVRLLNIQARFFIVTNDDRVLTAEPRFNRVARHQVMSVRGVSDHRSKVLEQQPNSLLGLVFEGFFAVKNYSWMVLKIN